MDERLYDFCIACFDIDNIYNWHSIITEITGEEHFRIVFFKYGMYTMGGRWFALFIEKKEDTEEDEKLP